MLIYIILYIIMVYSTFISSKRMSKRDNHYLLMILVFLSAMVCGLKDMLGGYDCYIYGEIFDMTSIEVHQHVPLFRTTAILQNLNEEGYGLYNVFLGYITNNRYIYILITTILYYAAIYRHIRKYSKQPLFFCFYYFFTFTYLRQMLACAICWFAIPFAIKRKPIQFFSIVVLAASFHNSALLFGILYFIAEKRFTLKQVYIILGMALFLGLTPLSTFLMQNLGGMVNQEKSLTSVEAANEYGNARLDYFIEVITFLFFFSIIYRNMLKDKLTICMANITFLFMLILLFFIRFTDGGRMSWYFIIGFCCLFPQIQETFKIKKTYRYYLIVLFSFLYFRILISWGPLLSPYRTFLKTNDKTDDPIWILYEYDHNYDNDNLYNLKK